MSLDLEQYQRRAIATAFYPHAGQCGHPVALAYCIGKLNGEAGEASEIFWKYQRSEGEFVKPNNETLRHIADELGDCLWYISALATEMGMTLEQVASWNLEKLASRSVHGKAGWSDARKRQALEPG